MSKKIVLSLEDMKDYMSEVGAEMVKNTRLMFGDYKSEEVMNLTAFYAAKLLNKILDEEKEDREV